jgi:serine/threonine-protein kinase
MSGLEGRVLAGRYRVVRLLGQGGMGAVYEAVQEDLFRRVALKVLRPEHAADPTVLARFHQEARAAARLAHPHIVQVSDFHAEASGEPPFLVMEYVEGQTLRALVEKEGPLPLPRIARIASQVLEALATAHAAGIIHRDIKPENLFVSSSATLGDIAKVLDFGIAKVEHGPAGASPMTQWGAILGTLTYMPPEQARGDVVDPRADLYALGGCMYFAASGRGPIQETDAGSYLVAIMSTVPRSLAEVRPEVDAMFDGIVMRALRKAPQERYGSADEMRAAIGAWLEAAPSARGRGVSLPPIADVPSTVGSRDLLEATRPSTAPGAARPETVPLARPVRASPPTLPSATPNAPPLATVPWSGPNAGGGVMQRVSAPPSFAQPVPSAAPSAPRLPASTSSSETRGLSLVLAVLVLVIFLAVAGIVGASCLIAGR